MHMGNSRRVNSLDSRIRSLYVPPGHYVAWTVTNQPYVTRAYPLRDGEMVPALLRLAPVRGCTHTLALRPRERKRAIHHPRAIRS